MKNRFPRVQILGTSYHAFIFGGEKAHESNGEDVLQRLSPTYI
ncbi:MAG TPA: hypothetical protein PLC38_09010 [Methanobacterium sp.]|nr:hypothetical protein [Methanobacterium sp.]